MFIDPFQLLRSNHSNFAITLLSQTHYGALSCGPSRSRTPSACPLVRDASHEQNANDK